MRIKGTCNTPDNLKDSFWELYTEKSIEKIKITDITTKAGLNRSSFYTYYANVYDIFSQIEKDVLSEILSIKDLLREFLLDDDIDPKKFKDLLDIYIKNEKYLKILLTKQDNPRFMYRLKKILKETLIEDMKKSPKYKATDEDAFFIEFYISGVINTIVFWFTKKSNISAEDFCAILKNIASHGSSSKLKEYMIDKSISKDKK